MPKNGNHFFTFTVFAPAKMVIHIFGPKAEITCGLQNMVQTSADVDAIGSAVLSFALHAGDLQVLLQTAEKLVFHC